MYKHLIWPAILALMVLMLAPASSEEFQGITFRLNLSAVEAIQPVNASSFSLVLGDKARDISLINSKGDKVGINYTYTFWKGDYTYNVTFDEPTTGYLSYILPSQGQQFVIALRDAGAVRVILPSGYATGDRMLGIARPDPDSVSYGDDGTVLTWMNTSQVPAIGVDYYRSTAPDALRKTFLILIGAALALLAEYHLSMRRLRSMREDADGRA